MRVLDDVLHLLRCPVCARPLSRAEGALACPRGHSFDVARQGYVSLLTGGAQQGTADTPAMVAARDAFLGAGHYDPLTEALAAAAAPTAHLGAVVDVGAGTGHHLARVLDHVGGVGLALDLSKPAVRRAARAHPRLGAVVADAWGPLPVRDGVAGAALSVFAPRRPVEAARLLAPGARLVVVTPTPAHLHELVRELGLLSVDPRKDERLARQLQGFALVSHELVEQRLELSEEDARNVVLMGPSAHHAVVLPAGGRTATLSVRVAAYTAARP